MKKILAIMLVLVLAIGAMTVLTACDGGADIAILTPNPTHDWAGSVGRFAEQRAKEITKEGTYTAKALAADDAKAQIEIIEDITANKNYKAVVILPMDNTVEEALKKLVATGIPVIQFDRLIASVEDDVVASVMGDNEAIGYETAKRFLANGLDKADKILMLQGDLSSVPEMRTNGFKKGLKELGNWTDNDIADAIEDLGSTGWQRATGEQLFTDWLNGADNDKIAATKWIFTHDDPIAMGIFDALNKTAIDDAKKTAFYAAEVNLASSAGALENYKLLAGEHKTAAYNDTYDKLADYFSVTYAPAMIIDAIDLMIDHLNGEKVEGTIVLPSVVVDATNVADFMSKGFGEE